ncbi:4159_t:CDS:1 [Funneliformis geosporum]|uniref:4159_t:CDS:1 n=1 Tax=Funneliformis geosporum TaxID=1117311 RepID=A0A9W4SPE6_9GLOM|nr:4159_t:CDS:1 [Funneliformis geosporum]
MIITLVPILFTGVAAYYLFGKFISKQLDCPNNNPTVKGLEKSEVKAAIKEAETHKKALEKEIKEIEAERKDILKGSEENKADQATEKLEAKEEKAAELVILEKDLADLKAVDKGGFMASVPNKLTMNNGL